MKTILLIDRDSIRHYRVSIYNYLYKYLFKRSLILKIVSDGIQQGNPYEVEFPYIEIKLNFLNLAKVIRNERPDAVIFAVYMRDLYLFPTLLFVKTHDIKAIYWGMGIDLESTSAKLKNILYSIEHYICDALILYADHLRKYIQQKYHYKIFISNNTLNITSFINPLIDRNEVLTKYNITTKKNIICVGRMQKRKRIDDLIQAFRLLKCQDVGLILIGPDAEGILNKIEDENIYNLGSIYGDDVLRLLSASDVFCMPGHVGLSIVDAFYCGLPFVTEKVDHAPEIMYLKEGINGFMVEKGDFRGLVEKLRLLLEDDTLRARFSQAAKDEIMVNGHIDNMCRGFLEAIHFVL